MNVIVTGATGLIGSAVAAALVDGGHGVVGVARSAGRASRGPAGVDWVALDIGAAKRPEDWLPHLAGVDAVVNCAGLFQDGPGNSVKGVHVEGTGALFAACERAGVRRVIHISAIGVDQGTPTAFSQTKAEADRDLMRRDLDWVILRPSVVVGRAAYGGSALFRGLAALPVLPLMPHTGPLQIVQLDEVVATVLFFIGPEAPSRTVLEIAGPERLSLLEVVQCYRRWLGWQEARVLRLPEPVAAALYRLGDFAGWLGWRPPMRSTARAELVRGAPGDATAWSEVTGIRPRALATALAREPAAVQERWFAGLYFLKPAIFVVLALFWILTGVISLGPGYGIGVDLMMAGGAGPLSGPSVIAGALADIVIGLGIAFRRTTKLAVWAAIALSLFYVVAGTAILPILWIEPLGPMLKIVPILVLHFVALAILEDR